MKFSTCSISLLVSHYIMALLLISSSHTHGNVAARTLRAKSKSSKKASSSRFEIKLTPDNEIAPFTGAENSFGSAEVVIKKDEACIDAKIFGFFPMAAHIHVAAIDANGEIVVDFTPLIDMGETDIDGCIKISKSLSERIMERPDLYYVNVHVGDSDPLILTAIRGQLLSSFSVTLDVDQTVAPFNLLAADATGFAQVSFESAGTIACYDTVIDDFDPGFAHIHMAAAGANGLRIFNFTSTKVGPGRFTGCQDVSSGDVEGDVAAVKALLADPEMYYFDYHLALTQPEVNQAIRGQIA